MAILRPLLLANGTRRANDVLEVPSVRRGGPAGATNWCFDAPVTAVTPLHTWTLSPAVPAQLWDIDSQAPTGTTALDLLNHAYMLFCRDNMDGVYAVPQELWTAVSVDGDICPLAWVDVHRDLTPRLLTPAAPPVPPVSSAASSAYGWFINTMGVPPTDWETAGFDAPGNGFHLMTLVSPAPFGADPDVPRLGGVAETVDLGILINPDDPNALEDFWQAFEYAAVDSTLLLQSSLAAFEVSINGHQLYVIDPHTSGLPGAIISLPVDHSVLLDGTNSITVQLFGGDSTITPWTQFYLSAV